MITPFTVADTPPLHGLNEVNHAKVELKGSFWGPRLKTHHEVTVPHALSCLDQRDGLLGIHKTWSGFSDIEVRWIDDSSLEISYTQNTSPACRDHNSVRVDSKHGIKIHYIVNS